MAKSPAALIIDQTGNKVGIVLDGSIYRLQSDSKIAKGDSDLVHLEVLDTESGKGRLKSTLYNPEGEAIAFGSIPSNPASIKNDFVKNGTNTSLLVDGSVTPVEFTYLPDATYDISIQEIKFVMVSNAISFGTNYFGATSGSLSNGLLIEIRSNDSPGTIFNIVQNECFIHFASPGGFNWVVSSKDMMSSTYLVGGALKLIHGSSDYIKVTVRDDIDSCASYFRCLVKGNLLN